MRRCHDNVKREGYTKLKIQPKKVKQQTSVKSYENYKQNY